jgi:hypothetical protein
MAMQLFSACSARTLQEVSKAQRVSLDNKMHVIERYAPVAMLISRCGLLLRAHLLLQSPHSIAKTDTNTCSAHLQHSSLTSD